MVDPGRARGSEAPAGGDGEPVPFGTTEGVGLYLNGTDLPDDVYEDNHIDDLIGGLLERLGPDGRMQSWWQGTREMALYFYGPSARREVTSPSTSPSRTLGTRIPVTMPYWVTRSRS